MSSERFALFVARNAHNIPWAAILLWVAARVVLPDAVAEAVAHFATGLMLGHLSGVWSLSLARRGEVTFAKVVLFGVMIAAILLGISAALAALGTDGGVPA